MRQEHTSFHAGGQENTGILEDALCYFILLNVGDDSCCVF